MGFFGRSSSSSRTRFIAVGATLALLFAADLSGAEIYKWKDESGRLHFSQDLNQIPPRYRAQAKDAAFEEGSKDVIQRYKPVPAAPRSTRRSRTVSEKKHSGKVYRIRVEKTGSNMRVNVRLNDQLTAPFYIDTGASDVSLPAWVVKELGLDLSQARTQLYNTANGTVQASLVMLDSVSLGGARVTNVPAHVSTSMSVGLLGLSFFNHFEYRVDPASGIVTLRPNGLAESGLIRGGRSERQWKGEFAGIAYRRARIEQILTEINPNGARRKAAVEDELKEVDRQWKVLEDEADDARVPMQWRD